MKKDFLTIKDLTSDEVFDLVSKARAFKQNKKESNSLKGKILGLIFEKESTRTRISFEVAMSKLGGQSLYMGKESSQMSRGESYADTARVLSRYLDALVLRTSSQKYLKEMAEAATIPVINGLSDLYHPCQVMADLMTILEKKGKLKELKIAYIGDGNNMANSWIEASNLLGLDLRIACPKGFEPKITVDQSKFISISSNPIEAVKDCNVLNTDTWFSMGQKISDEKKELFASFQVNSQLIKNAAPDFILMHCLPAHRGEEITSEVLDGPHSVVLDQAENRLYIQMALLEALII